MYELLIRWFDTSYYDEPVMATYSENMLDLRRRLVGILNAQNLSRRGDGQVGTLVTEAPGIDGVRVVAVYEFRKSPQEIGCEGVAR